MHFSTIVVALASAVTALKHGVDSSVLVDTATYKKALGEGFTKAVIRGYQEACGSGGRVDPNFVQTYKNARAAGYTDIDTYFFPCTGSGNSCKSFATQISELGATFKANSMDIGRIWIDIEQDSVCNPFNYGASGNLNVAKQLVTAFRNSGYKFGIYSSPGEWSNIFGSRSVVVANDVPLWFAQYNNAENLNMNEPFGGWTAAEGHQYTDKSASGKFDLNVFA